MTSPKPLTLETLAELEQNIGHPNAMIAALELREHSRIIIELLRLARKALEAQPVHVRCAHDDQSILRARHHAELSAWLSGHCPRCGYQVVVLT